MHYSGVSNHHLFSESFFCHLCHCIYYDIHSVLQAIINRENPLSDKKLLQLKKEKQQKTLNHKLFTMVFPPPFRPSFRLACSLWSSHVPRCLLAFCACLFLLLSNVTCTELDVVTCGSVLKLQNIKFSSRLHSHDVKYGSGSGQQSVTGVEGVDDHNR